MRALSSCPNSSLHQIRHCFLAKLLDAQDEKSWLLNLLFYFPAEIPRLDIQKPGVFQKIPDLLTFAQVLLLVLQDLWIGSRNHSDGSWP